MLCKPVCINRGGGHHHLQVGAARQNLPQVAQQKVNVQAALVRLVNDDRVVGLEQRIVLGFGQQDAVGHELDARGFAQPILKPDFVAHHFTQWGLQLFGNALGHRTGGNTPWLCVPDQPTPLNRSSARR